MKIAILLMIAVLSLALPAHAGDGSDLYKGRIVVTGMMPENRPPALAVCLRDVLVKVSGDPRLLDDPAAAALGRHAADLVTDLEYLDRMSGIQIHDEQGSRDRSFILTVTFDQAKIDAALQALERMPWPAPRPKIAIVLAVHDGRQDYLLASDGAHGRDQRESLEAVSWQMGLPVVMPDSAALAGIRFDSLPDGMSPDAVAKAAGGGVALTGRLVWNPGTLGWAADWRMSGKGTAYRWQIRDVNFDDAFRSAVRGAAQILSGHGAP